MKIDRKKIGNRIGCDEPSCRSLALKLGSLESDEELVREISSIKRWTYGKCQLGLWADVLDHFDSIFEKCVAREDCEKQKCWTLALDSDNEAGRTLRNYAVSILDFTSHLVEHSIYRFLYSSLEHVTLLLSASADPDVLLAALQLLYVFSKRSNYLADRIEQTRRKEIVQLLYSLADTWGGIAAGLSLACVASPNPNLPVSASSVHMEYSTEGSSDGSSLGQRLYIHVEMASSASGPGEVMENLLKTHPLLPKSLQPQLFSKLCLASALRGDQSQRLKCVKARLLALSILSYNFSLDDTTAYPGLLEELVEVLATPSVVTGTPDEVAALEACEDKGSWLLELQASALRTLTALLHSTRRNFMLGDVLTACGAGAPRGVLPTLVRRAVNRLVEERLKNTPATQQLLTAMLSFLYHLASNEEQEASHSGNDSRLAGAGLVEPMLRLVDWHTPKDECLTLVTRAVRVTDHLTGGSGGTGGGAHSAVDQHAVLQSMLRRLDYELGRLVDDSVSTPRAALMKGLLSLVKRVIMEPDWAEPVRHAMDGTLPNTLVTMVKNRSALGPQLLLVTLDIVANYVFQEPSQLSSLQDKGLTEEILSALSSGPLPVWRELLTELPRLLSALALNHRGAAAVISSGVIKQLVRTLVQEDYLPAMKYKSRDGADHGLEHGVSSRISPSSLGFKMDELIRTQAVLQAPVLQEIMDLLEELLRMRSTYTCTESRAPTPAPQPAPANTESMSDEDDEDLEEEMEAAVRRARARRGDNESAAEKTTKEPHPLSLYTLHVVTFLEALMSAHGGAGQERSEVLLEFVRKGGMKLLLKLITGPGPLSEDFPINTGCSLLASLFKMAYNNKPEPAALQALLSEVLSALHEQLIALNAVVRDLRGSDEPPLFSLFLRDQLQPVPSAQEEPPSSVPLKRGLIVVHAFLVILEGMIRLNGREQRSAVLQLWSQDTGLEVLVLLRDLYLSLVWESSVLLSLCCEETELCREDLRQLELEARDEPVDEDQNTTFPENVSAAFPMFKPPASSAAASVALGAFPAQRKKVQTYLRCVGRSARAITDLFGLLVRQSSGSVNQRHHRRHHPPQTALPAAVQLSAAVTKLMNKCFHWRPAPEANYPPKLVYSYYVAGINFASSVFFDAQRQPLILTVQSLGPTGTLRTFFDLFRSAVLLPDPTLR